MWGDKLQEAINTINAYVENGCTIYLYDEKTEQQITLKDDTELKFYLLSK